MMSENKCRILVFAGKGGVGKTTCAAATALHCASSGGPTLCISTDATPSLSHIFEIAADKKPARVDGSLYIHELGLEQIKEMWDRKFGKEVYEVFSSFVSIDYAEFTEFMTSLLPGLGDEFMVDYIRELSQKGEYGSIVWDTAPLGQTLALLETPAMLAQHLKMAPRIYSRLKLGQRSREPILDIIQRWEKLSDDNMDFLREEVKFNIVTIPEALAVEQLEYVFQELNRHDLTVKQLIINNVVNADGSDFMCAKSRQQKHYIKVIRDKFPGLPIAEIPMFPYEIRGSQRVREVSEVLFR